MSFLRGSTNYVWCTTSVLGKGATGSVFQGVNKNTGEPVAVKTFNQLSHMRPHDVQLREFEVLKKVKHENIVKLLAIEEEQEGKGKVIVMELCTGGSLFNILDDPENTYGLKEEEFLLVLEHLSAGMKHLRDNHLVHRDLKPGNIMKFISDEGNTIYKLTDFGAARELEEDEQFVSLYGTEEYLHPDMYERAVLRKAVRKTFGATVDLWSIGVTLYHVATGNLPFRPYGGRRNKETMYFITTKKESGVISGTQSLENGPINYCRSLPSNCQLSNGLKKSVTPLLAGLLEVDTQKIWTFERFFSEVTNTLSRKRIHVYHIHRMQMIRVYLHPEETYADLQENIREQTDVPAKNQIILFDNKHILQIVSESLPGKLYPDSSDDDPFFLFSNEYNNVTVPIETEHLKLPSFPTSVNVEHDASLAKTICSIGHVCKRRIEKLCLASRLTHRSVGMFNSVVQHELTAVVNKTNKHLEMTQFARKLMDAILRSQRTVNSILGMGTKVSINSNNLDLQCELDAISQEFNGISTPIKQLHNRYVTMDTLAKEWETNTNRCKCCWKSRAAQRAASIVQRLRDSWQHMIRDRATRSLTYNDEQFHVLERMKMEVMSTDLMKNLLDKEVMNSITQVADYLADWYKMAQTIYLQGKILDRDVDVYKFRLEKFIPTMEDSHKSFHEEIINVGLIKPIPRHNGRIKGQDMRSLRTSVRDIHNSQEEIASLIKGNRQLVDKFCSMASKLGDSGRGNES
ncbi:serine threonine-protein kinase [Nesidiocoris tenuis]|uniref:Serine threonine-protein kinase n=1 Tax=Nesidiocoris tenuis TaxID=355587 RepID=A0ABN7AD59_9HEMI|nr:serine threonine-protein kinase [Nesidiocoris tenuis]